MRQNLRELRWILEDVSIQDELEISKRNGGIITIKSKNNTLFR